jgi:RND family efflux transporter MFP subunit
MHQPPPPQNPPVAPNSNPYLNSLAAAGIVEAREENVAIGVPTSGLVTQMLVKAGQHVAAGQPLFRLDDRELAAQLKVNQADLELKQAQLHKGQDQLRRLESVVDQRAIPAEDLTNQKNDVRIAEAAVKAAEAAVNQTQQLLNRLTVTAPKAASILQINLRVGEYASPTPSEPAIVLGETKLLQVRADIDEQNASRVALTKGATAFLKGQPDHPIPLRFVEVKPFVIPKKSLTGGFNERVDTRVLQVIFEFEKGDIPVFVGQQVDVFMALSS